MQQSCDSRPEQLSVQVSKIDPAAHESDAKHQLVHKINTYIQEKIVFADNVLVTNAVAKVYTDDVILTYGFSSVVFNVLLRAKKVCEPCMSGFALSCLAGETVKWCFAFDPPTPPLSPSPQAPFHIAPWFVLNQPAQMVESDVVIIAHTHSPHALHDVENLILAARCTTEGKQITQCHV